MVVNWLTLADTIAGVILFCSSVLKRGYQIMSKSIITYLDCWCMLINDEVVLEAENKKILHRTNQTFIRGGKTNNTRNT